jgi:hypothetical protein
MSNDYTRQPPSDSTTALQALVRYRDAMEEQLTALVGAGARGAGGAAGRECSARHSRSLVIPHSHVPA